MSLQVSIDQGDSTGICVWHKGSPLHTKTFRGKAPSGRMTDETRFFIKVVDQFNGAWRWLEGLQMDTGENIDHIVMESFVKYVPPERSFSVNKLYLRSGILVGLFYAHMPIGTTIEFRGKGTVPKKQAKVLAKKWGLQNQNSHEIDAVHIGVLAGFDARA